MKKMKNWLPMIVGLLLIVLGAGYMLKSSRVAPPPAPEPTATFSASPDTVTPAGPTKEATVNVAPQELDEEKAESEKLKKSKTSTTVEIDESPTDESELTTEADDVTYTDDSNNSDPLTGRLSQPASEKVVKTADTMGPSRLFIPALGTYARVETHPIKNGLIQLNKNPRRLTRMAEGATVTDKDGAIVISGHVSWNGAKGALYNLSDVKQGNIAYVSDARGNIAKFKLVSLQSYKKADLPASATSQTLGRRLVIITCGGAIRMSSDGRHYDKNIVATFVPTK